MQHTRTERFFMENEDFTQWLHRREWFPSYLNDPEPPRSSGPAAHNATISPILIKPDPASLNALQFEPIVHNLSNAWICTIRSKPDPASPDALEFEPIVRDLSIGQSPRCIGRYFTKYGDIGLAAKPEPRNRSLL